MARTIIGVAGALFIMAILWDAFETVILPRRVHRSLRLTRLFYRATWAPWSGVARRLPRRGGRESFLGFFGPLSLILLLVVWAIGLILGYALLHWGMRSKLDAFGAGADFGTTLYFSGSTFFTLGLGDVTPRTAVTRLLAVAEAGTGFAFLALVIGYVPVLYQAFSRREVSINQLDARAGSPPSSFELLLRQSAQGMATVDQWLAEWERWAAELLESQLSYPLLGYYRSQHDNQSWLAALTTLLDLCAIRLTIVDEANQQQARLTFAMARHAAVDLAQTFGRRMLSSTLDRLPRADLERGQRLLGSAGIPVRSIDACERELGAMRELYEPYVEALSEYILMALPPWLAPESAIDDWEATAWGSAGGPRRR